MKNASQLLLLLKQQHLIGDIELNKAQEVSSPWYIKTLMGLCGWLAAIFILGFIAAAMASIFDNPVALGIVGIALITGAYFLLVSSDSEFVEHLGLAVSLAGQSLVAFALFFNSAVDESFSWFILAIVQCILAYLMPNYIHRMMSAYFATVSLSLFMMVMHLSSYYSAIVLLVVALLWLNEFTFSRHVRKLQAVGYGAVIGLIQFKTSILFASGGTTWLENSMPTVVPWLDEGLNILVMLYVLHHLVKHRKLVLAGEQKWFAIALLVLIGAGTLFANGIVCGILIMIIGFAIQNRVLLILGILATLMNLSSYYYLLDISLLHKSFILAGLGGAGVLLAFIQQRLSSQGEPHVE
ncbi:DUF4401 domain-containing protein [Aliiglaciecola litoralis]|uniref:DUF4401 domain-containing protein n=1 Tax=Aliiglaciecola litoralis TaxID=582857 RepID=A0ABN1LE48_9ALTE